MAVGVNHCYTCHLNHSTGGPALLGDSTFHVAVTTDIDGASLGDSSFFIKHSTGCWLYEVAGLRVFL